MTTVYRKYYRQYAHGDSAEEMDFNYSDARVDCYGGYLTDIRAMEWINKWNTAGRDIWTFWIRRSDGAEEQTVYATKQFLRVGIAETLCVNAGALNRHEALALADILLAQFDINIRGTK